MKHISAGGLPEFPNKIELEIAPYLTYVPDTSLGDFSATLIGNWDEFAALLDSACFNNNLPNFPSPKDVDGGRSVRCGKSSQFFSVVISVFMN